MNPRRARNNTRERAPLDTTQAAYDVIRLRAHFPGLVDGAAHFDGPGGSQTPDVVAEAISRLLTGPLSNRGRLTVAERNADRAVTEGRAAVADFLNADPQGVIFGRSMTALTFELARTMAKDWGPGDEVVVSRLDHDGNVRPWVIAAEAVGARVRWVGFDPATGELDPAAVAEQLGPRTRLVAVTGAANLIGTRPDLPAIAAAVHAGRCLAVRRRGPPGAPCPGRRPGARRGLLRLLALQVPRPALRRGGRPPGAAGGSAAGQAGAVVGRRARAVRARHPAVRAAGRDHRRHRLPG